MNKNYLTIKHRYLETFAVQLYILVWESYVNCKSFIMLLPSFLLFLSSFLWPILS